MLHATHTYSDHRQVLQCPPRVLQGLVRVYAIIYYSLLAILLDVDVVDNNLVLFFVT